MDYVDYFIGDPVTTPLDHAAHFSEKLAQMPLCYQPNDAKRALPRAEPPADWGALEMAVRCWRPSTSRYQDLGRGVRQLVPHPARRARCDPLWLLRWNTNVQAVLEAAARNAASIRRGCIRLCPCCRSNSILAPGLRRPLPGTPGPATPTPPPARRCGPACRC